MNHCTAYFKENLLHSLALTVRRAHGLAMDFTAFTETSSGSRTTWEFQTDGRLKTLKIMAREIGNTVVFSLDADLGMGAAPQRAFASGDAISLSVGPLQPEAINANYLDKLWWTIPAFCHSYEEIPDNTQSMLIHIPDHDFHLLMLTGDNFRCEWEKGHLAISSDMAGLNHLTGTFLAITAAGDPFEAIEQNFTLARRMGAIRVPLRRERKLPDLFKAFGFCTWDCFYGKVSSQGVFTKLDEFKEKGIPIKWIIIDDGWLSTRDGKLAAFEANGQFPEGMKAFVTKVKQDYGVEKIGVWHAFEGYWNGIDPESPLYEKYKDCLTIVPQGFCVPSLDEEKAFRFWDDWHSFLADCGVDFVKVDNQSSYAGMVEGAAPTAIACRAAHAALDRSVFKNFGGAIINCMGMDMENALARPQSCVSRNSDDFFPRAPRGFAKHLVQNVYNAMTFGQLYVCDYDMWWSDHESSVQSGVLRAISGSPIYVSDEVGRSKYETIAPVIEDDGSLMLMDGFGCPTLDQIYSDCRESGDFQKVWNYADTPQGRAFALAVFNVTEKEKTEFVPLSDIPGFSGRFLAYEYFSGMTSVVDEGTVLQLTLAGDGTAACSFYPIITAENCTGDQPDADGVEGAYVGSFDKYLPIASARKTWKALKDF